MTEPEASQAESEARPLGDPAPVLIIGAGLIGTSIGLALAEQGVATHLSDATPSHALVAAGLGAGLVDPPDQVGLVIVAVPPAVTAAVVVQALRDYPAATVTDVASVKAPILARVRAAGADLGRYVGSHPMAGSHRTGPLTARADLFRDRTWVIAVHPQIEPDRLRAVQAIAETCQARLELMDPVEHDQAVAEISHVPQILSSLLAGDLTGLAPAHLRLAGQGVRDVTRIAASDEAMWTQITLANQTAIGAQLARLAATLDQVRSQLDSPDQVAEFFRLGVEGTKALPGKHGRSGLDYEHVVVEIPDSPGALARLFADVDAAGANVEDLAIEHDAGREVGYLAIAVEATKAASLAEAIAQAGWTLRL